MDGKGRGGAGQTGSDVIEPLEFLLFDVVVTDTLSADDTLRSGKHDICIWEFLRHLNNENINSSHYYGANNYGSSFLPQNN